MLRVAPQQAERPRKIFSARTSRCGTRDDITMRHHRSHFARDQFVWSCNGLIFRIMFARNRILATSDRDAFAFWGRAG
jgi:cold shock protein